MPQGSVTTATQTPHHPELVKSESNSFEPKESDFRRLSRKILKTQAEKERYAKILSNEKNLKEALSQI